MIIECGKEDYRNLVTDTDFLDVIREKISFEFATELQKWFDEADYEKSQLDEENMELLADNDYYVRKLEEIYTLVRGLRVDLTNNATIKKESKQATLKILEEIQTLSDI